MTLSNEELKKIYHGAYRFEETKDGFLQAFQFNKEQTEYFKKTSEFWYDHCCASSGKTLEFVTTAENFSFEYKIIYLCSPDSFEVAVDGLITSIVYVKDLDKEGKLEFKLPKGNKNVVLYLPDDATVIIRNFEIDAPVCDVTKNAKVLLLGDSISQGFGPFRSSCTYANVMNRIMNYELLNQSIGGYIYDAGSLMKLDNFTPDKLIVFLGTNQFGTESMKDIEDFYIKLFEIYGTDIPIIVITPLWRGDVEDGEPTLISFCEKLKAIIAKYPHIKMIEGWGLLPHLPEYYLDKLHPNQYGAEILGRRIADEIQRLKF